MPARRELTMRQLRQMLRLHHDGVAAREIGRALSVARSTVQDNLKRAAVAGLAWPLPPELTDDELEQRLFARAGVMSGFRRRTEPDWATLAREIKRPGVNLMVLWEEYRQVHPDGYGYSRFCDLFQSLKAAQVDYLQLAPRRRMRLSIRLQCRSAQSFRLDRVSRQRTVPRIGHSCSRLLFQ